MRVAVVLFALTGCVGSYLQAVEETRADFRGMSARDLVRCLGAPIWLEQRDDVELQTYRFERSPEDDDPRGRAGPWGDVRVGGGGESGIFTGSPRPHDTGQGYCQLDFELRAGVVADVTATGRTADGLNASAACLLEARRCLPPDE